MPVTWCAQLSSRVDRRPSSDIDDIRQNDDARAWAEGDLAAIFPGARYRSNWYTIDPARGDLAAIAIHSQWIYVDAASDTVIVKPESRTLGGCPIARAAGREFSIRDQRRP